jgi:hypothetical protein
MSSPTEKLMSNETALLMWHCSAMGWFILGFLKSTWFFLFWGISELVAILAFYSKESDEP